MRAVVSTSRIRNIADAVRRSRLDDPHPSRFAEWPPSADAGAGSLAHPATDNVPVCSRK